MTAYSKGVVVLPGYVVVGVRDLSGAYSTQAVAVAPSKVIAPMAPVLTELSGVSNAPGTLQLSLELPTTNTDGSVLAISEVVRLRVHFSTSPGVSTSDPYNDFPPAEVMTWAPNLSGTVYVKARVQDSHGNWSSLSNELSELVPEVEPFEFWAHRLNSNAIFSNNTPSSGYVSWSNVTVYFKNLGYSVGNGNTNQRYIYWRLSSPTGFQTSNTVPSLGIDDVLIGTNIDGTWYLAIYHPQVSAEFIRVGKLQSTNWGTSTGSELDLDTGTFKLGGSTSPKLAWNGSVLSVTGSITATGGSIPYAYVDGGPPVDADKTATIISGGLITTGRIELGSSGYTKAGIDGSGTAESSIRIWAGSTYANRSSAPFRVTQGGSLVATSATITGTITSSTITASTIKTAETGYRVEISNVGSYPLQYWNGSTRKFYVDLSGNVYVSGQIISASGSQISGSHLSGGSITGIPVYGAGSYPYSYMYGESFVAYQTATYHAIVGPSGVVVSGAQDVVFLNQRELKWQFGDPTIQCGGHLTLRSGSGYYTIVNTSVLMPSSIGSTNLGSATYYWNEVNYKSLVDRGCLGWFDRGVELNDGRVVSDVEAICEIRPHQSLMTPYNTPRIDYSTLPKAVFRPGTVKDGKKIGEDGACIDALLSIMIGAIKELDKRILAIEDRLGEEE